MRWLILSLLAGVAMAAQAHAQAPSDVLCSVAKAEWDKVKDGRDVAAMDRVIRAIGPHCTQSLGAERRRNAAAASLQVEPQPRLGAAPRPSAPAVLGYDDVTWLGAPSGDDVAQYYPERAQRMSIEGRATIECAVEAAGTLSECQVESESPADQEFGKAALSLAKLFRMNTRAPDGASLVGDKVRIPLQFQLPKD